MKPQPTAAFLNEVTGRIIEAAIEIHRTLGPGLLEAAYLTCLVYELTGAGMRLERERAIPLTYKEVRLDCAYRIDVVVEGCVLVEVKALGSIADIHLRQLMNVLAAGRLPRRITAQLRSVLDERRSLQEG